MIIPCVLLFLQVLVSVHAQIERYVAARPDYPALVTQAWRFLLAKDQDSKFRGLNTHTNTRKHDMKPQLEDLVPEAAAPLQQRNNSIVKFGLESCDLDLCRKVDHFRFGLLKYWHILAKC